MGCFSSKNKRLKKRHKEVPKEPNPEQLKEQGNAAFRNGENAKAVECYTEAIKLNPDVSIYYSNRALCYMNLKMTEEAKIDGIEAIGLDSSNFKGFLIISRATAELSKHSSKDLCDEASFYAEKAKIIATHKKDSGALEYIEELKLKIQAIKSYKDFQETSLTTETLKAHYKQVLDPFKFSQLEKVLEVKDDNNYLESLVCPITLELFCNPIVLSSGISYEKKPLLEHFSYSGTIDPVSRMPLYNSAFVENKQLKQAVTWYLQFKPWVKFSSLQHKVTELSL